VNAPFPAESHIAKRTHFLPAGSNGSPFDYRVIEPLRAVPAIPRWWNSTSPLLTKPKLRNPVQLRVITTNRG